MVSFEEEYPSLEGMRKHIFCRANSDHGITSDYDEEGRFIDVVLVQKHCVDKAKIRDLIKELEIIVNKNKVFKQAPYCLGISEAIVKLRLLVGD